MIGRALLKEFPEEADIFSIGALQLGNQIIRTHNGLIGRYPGADGMKTGFTCAAGFNLVASATHGGKRLIVVVLGSPGPVERNAKAIALFDHGFSQWGGELGPIDKLPSPGVGAAPDMHEEVCSRRGRAAAVAEDEEEMRAVDPVAANAGSGASRGLSFLAALTPAPNDPMAIARMPVAHFDPVPVFIGPKPGWTGPVAAAKPTPPATDKALSSAPESASAYVGLPEKSPDAEAPAGASTAPLALQGAVHGGTKLGALAIATKNLKKTSDTRSLKTIAVVATPKKPTPADAAVKPPLSQ
jgi:D-alanyl-D-alanine carboxypeptidase